MGICISLWNMRCKCKWDSVSIYNRFFWYNGVLVESVQDYGGSFGATEYLSTDIFVVSIGNLLTNGLPKNYSWWWISAAIWWLTVKGVHSITEIILFQHCVIYNVYVSLHFKPSGELNSLEHIIENKVGYQLHIFVTLVFDRIPNSIQSFLLSYKIHTYTKNVELKYDTEGLWSEAHRSLFDFFFHSACDT